MKFKRSSIVVACLMATVAGSAMASSHREAPFITTSPKVDGTDFYMFRSYEEVKADGTGGRSDFVTLIANYQPLQGPYGGPNYFSMDPNALYEIHIDNTGDAKEDITFQFKFKNELQNYTQSVNGVNVAIPLVQQGVLTTDAKVGENLNLRETYTVGVARGGRRSGSMSLATNVSAGGTSFTKPVDYIGEKTLGDSKTYEGYAMRNVHSVKLPGCTPEAKVFVGQRAEGFAVNLGTVFDLVNEDAGVLTEPNNKNAYGQEGTHYIQKTNVTTIALEIHKDCLTGSGNGTIGGWTTASMRQARLLNGKPGSGHQASEKAGGAWVQVSRLGNPLVNELVIGLKDKDKFNASKPEADGQFLDYVMNPTLPNLLSVVLDEPKLIPNIGPRTDLATVFLAGIAKVNQLATVTPSEMLRLNTKIAPKPFEAQNRLGIAGAQLSTDAGRADDDLAGFPNGRRPKDDVVDIALVAMVGGLCFLNESPDGLNKNRFGLNAIAGQTSNCEKTSLKSASFANLHDGVDQAAVKFKPSFPYLNTPNPGATTPTRAVITEK